MIVITASDVLKPERRYRERALPLIRFYDSWLAGRGGATIGQPPDAMKFCGQRTPPLAPVAKSHDTGF
jgi:hypothetical protein